MKAIIYTFILISNTAMALESSKKIAHKTQNKEKNILLLLNKEIKMVESVKNIGANLSHRLLELYSERLAIIKSKENSTFLEKSKPGEKKSKYFAQTTTEFKRVQSFGHKTLRKFPRSVIVPYVYYTLALNSRDFDNNKNTEQYLSKSLALATDNELKYQIKSALGDYYYNSKKYNKAISYYEWVIKNTDDEWRTKTLYNLSWCLLKVENYQGALDKQLESYHASQLPGMINMTSQAINTLPTFFTLADRSKEGLEFFLKNDQNSSISIIKMAKRASENGDYPQAVFLVNSADDHYSNNHNWEQLVRLKNYKLKFYRQYKRNTNFYQTAQQLRDIYKKYTASEQLRSETIEDLKSFAGYQQLLITKATKQNITKISQENIDQTIDIFEILISIDPSQLDQYAYFQAETFLSLNQYQNAIEAYKRSLESNVTGKDIVLREKIFNSMIHIIEKNTLKENDKYLVYTFNMHIQHLPQHPRTQKIFPRLVGHYLKNKDTLNTEKTLAQYIKSFPQHQDVQNKLARSLIDQYTDSENTTQINIWVGHMSKGLIGFSNDDRKKLENILGQLLFKKALDVEKTNDLNAANEMYLALYKNELYPSNIRGKAALKIAILNEELNNPSTSLEWLEISYRFLDKEEYEKNLSLIQFVSDLYLLKQHFSQAKDANLMLAKSNCSKLETLAKEAYHKAIISSVFIDNYFSIETQLKHMPCPFPKEVTQELVLEIANNWNNKDDSDKLKSLVFNWNQHQPKIVNIYWDYLRKEYWFAVTADAEDQRNLLKEIKFFEKKFLRTQKYSNEVETLQSTLKKIRNFNSPDWSRDEEQFNEEVFITKLTTTINNLKAIKTSAAKSMSSKNPNITLISSAKLIEAYQKVIKVMKNFNPKGLDTDYMASLHEQLTAMRGQLEKTVTGIKKSAIASINKYRVMTPSNSKFFEVGDDINLLNFIGSNQLLATSDFNQGN